MISTAMRHGAKLEFIVEQLNKAEGSIVSFNKAIARTLKRYLGSDSQTEAQCPECKEPEGMVLTEGCRKCKNCGYSVCG
jgi:ribonucleoside-diphosphate reductase alpha chain